jgi:hypothetical protein
MRARAHSMSAPPKRLFRPGQSGVGALEFLIALPILLVLGLGAWQWAIVLQARQVLEHAVAEAARGGALGHASEQSIDQGLARGLLTFWPSRSGREPKAQLAQSEARLSAAQQANWIAWRQLSPCERASVIGLSRPLTLVGWRCLACQKFQSTISMPGFRPCGP